MDMTSGLLHVEHNLITEASRLGVIMLLEHWLTPAKLSKFNRDLSNQAVL